MDGTQRDAGHPPGQPPPAHRTTWLAAAAGHRPPGLPALLVLVPLVCAALPAALAAAVPELSFDTDADGVVDLTETPPGGASAPGGPPDRGLLGDRDGDGRLERALRAAPPAPAQAPAELTDMVFQLAWDSGSILSNVLCVEAGDADRDGLFDLAGTHFAPNVIHLFEADGAGSYTETWNSAAATPPASYRDLVFADTDGDGLGEILGGEVSTLGKVMLFEQGASGFEFLHDTVRETDLTGARRLRSVLVGDTDQDGRQEIVVATGGSNPTSGLVGIWEHSGAIGDNTYTRVYTYTTVSYLFRAALGDADNDGYPEIVLGLGGLGGHPLVIRRLEYDPGAGTWVHHQQTTGIVGLPLAPHVADLDGDGDRELAYGSAAGGGFVVVFEHTGAETFAPVFVSGEVLGGNVLTLDTHATTVPATMSLAAGSFGGDVAIWSYDAGSGTYQQTASLFGLGAAVEQLALEDDGADGFEELVLALSGGVDQVQVYRREDSVGVPDAGPVAAASARLVAAPNPCRAGARLALDGVVDGGGARGDALLRIVDVHGRLVRQLALGTSGTRWDARDLAGERVASGVYWVMLETAGRAAAVPPLRVVVLR
jgi:hypothetical protein